MNGYGTFQVINARRLVGTYILALPLLVVLALVHGFLFFAFLLLVKNANKERENMKTFITVGNIPNWLVLHEETAKDTK